MTDPHFKTRGFPTPVFHEDLGRAVSHAGAPFLLEKSPWGIRHRAPRLGEHQTQVLGALRR
jgi:crotonobetainyl-CoA:carnitine CoA-transferase CaiB-like acyl-CoA transferase